MWILMFILVTNNGTTSSTAEFTSLERCELAMKQISEIPFGISRGYCLEK